MGQMPSILVVYALSVGLLVVTRASTLYPCDSSGYRDVEENKAVTFYCDQYNGSAVWRYKGPVSNAVNEISTCSSTNCVSTTGSTVIKVTFLSAGNSSLTSYLTSRTLDQAGGEYRCDDMACKLHIIETAVISKPISNISKMDQGYSVHCSTFITTVYSSRGHYSCVWQNGTTQVNGTLNLQPPPHDTNNTSDRMGTCNATLQLSNHSDAICNVTVLPGNVVASSRIVRPSQPNISCPTCPVPENTNITCTCTTDKLGQPGGRLVWYAGSNGVFDRDIARGNFEINTLTMTWPLNRSDHNVTLFRCVNEWIENVNSSTDFTAIVNLDAPSSAARRRRKRSTDTTSSQCHVSTTDDGMPGADSLNVALIAGSIGGVVAVVCVVVAVVCVIKRKRKVVQKTTSGNHQDGDRTGRKEDPDYDVEIVNSCNESSESTYTTGTYQGLAVEDVGIPSNYEQLSRYGNVPSSQPESRDNPSFGAYESLQSADVGQTSVYSEMTHGSGPVYGNSATQNK